MITLNPTAQFQANTESLQAFKNLVRGETIQRALVMSVAEYTLLNSPSAEQSKAVKAFIDVFLNIGEQLSTPAPPFTMPKLIPPEQFEELAKRKAADEKKEKK